MQCNNFQINKQRQEQRQQNHMESEETVERRIRYYKVTPNPLRQWLPD